MQAIHFHEADFESSFEGLPFHVGHVVGRMPSSVGEKQRQGGFFPFSSGRKCLKDPFCICFEQVDSIIL